MATEGVEQAVREVQIAEVQLRVHAYTSGGGSTSRVSFRHPDSVFVPYVRFDFF
ncbi:hypothetical protein [Deferrisoma camini]|uniref:hypothetical protein n=1 Tax=Deferrisoma camini TaxID=1035120 RepID=UPI0004B6C2C1|nr:hypothetical protein [Deferrisoma camini]